MIYCIFGGKENLSDLLKALLNTKQGQDLFKEYSELPSDDIEAQVNFLIEEDLVLDFVEEFFPEVFTFQDDDYVYAGLNPFAAMEDNETLGEFKTRVLKIVGKYFTETGDFYGEI